MTLEQRPVRLRAHAGKHTGHDATGRRAPSVERRVGTVKLQCGELSCGVDGLAQGHAVARHQSREVQARCGMLQSSAFQ